VRDETQQIVAVDGRVTEARSAPVPVRIQAATADLHHLAGSALRRQGVGPDLPGHRGRVVQRIVEAAGRDVQPDVGGAGIRRAERVELLDGAIGVDRDERARQEPKSLYRARAAEHELDKLAEQPDPCFLPRRGVPAFEDADQPVRVAGRRRSRTPVGVRQQKVKRWGVELQQRLVSRDRVVADVDRAQDAAIAVTEFRRLEQGQAVGDRVEAVAAVGVPAMPPGRFGIAVETDADLDPQALEHLEHGPVEKGAVGLEGNVHLRRYLGLERTD
jgi:hypothetical protein